MRFSTIGSLLTGSHAASFIAPSASVSEAAKLMKSRNAGALVVMHDSDSVGIVCKTDIVDGVIARHRDPDVTPISELSAPVECVERSATLDLVWSRMIQASLGYVAVRDTRLRHRHPVEVGHHAMDDELAGRRVRLRHRSSETNGIRESPCRLRPPAHLYSGPSAGEHQ